jgi:LysR family transcriptional regulator, low CO2-responsive transcriptional regulator
MFETRHLKTFQLLARTRSFSETARRLFLTQSAVSHQIRALEREASTRLFDRARNGVYLTQPGELLLRYVDETIARLEEAQAALAEMQTEGRGRLRLGVSAALGLHLLPPVLREFKRRYAQQQISVVLGDTPPTVERLIKGDLDVGVVVLPVARPDIETLDLFEDELAVIVYPGHPWAKRKRIDVVEIPKQQFIVYSKSSATFRIVEKFFQDEGIVLSSFIEAGDIEMVKELIKLELGVGIMAPWTAQKEIQSGSLVARRLTQRRIRRTWGLIHMTGRAWPPSHRVFSGLCRNLMPPTKTLL